MRKLFLIALVITAVLSLAVGPAMPMRGPAKAPMGAPMIPRDVPEFEKIELTGKITGFGFYNGRLFVTVEATDEKYYVLVPVMALRFENFEVKMGDEISVVGQKTVYKNENVVFPIKMSIGDKKFDFLTQLKRIWKDRYWIYPKWWIMERKPLGFRSPQNFMGRQGAWNRWWMMDRSWRAPMRKPDFRRIPYPFMGPAPQPMPAPQGPMMPGF